MIFPLPPAFLAESLIRERVTREKPQSLLTSGRRGAAPGKPRSGRRNRHREMALEEQMGCTTSRDKPWVVGLHTVSFLPCDKVHRLGW